MRGAAGVLLGTAVKQRRIRKTRAAHGGAAAIEEQRRTAGYFAVERQRRGARHRRIRCRVAVNAHAARVVETNPCLLNHLRRQALSSECNEKFGEIG